MREIPTNRLYWNQWSHRLVILTRWRGLPRAPTGEMVRWILDTNFTKGYRATESTTYDPRNNWKIKNYKISVFFKDPRVFEVLRAIIPQEFMDLYESPQNAGHLDLLERDKVIVREKLFYGRFPLSIRLTPRKISGGRSTRHYQDVLDWCVDQMGPMGERWHMNSWHNATVFFRDRPDAMLMKLTWGDDQTRTQRVVLVSDLP